MKARAVILAAGRGSRMGPLTDALPKCLVPLAGRPLLEWQISALRGAGICDVGIVRGYSAHLLDGRGLVAFDNARWANTNMVRSLACASAWLCEGPTIVSYSDIFYSAAVVSSLVAAPGDITISYDANWLALWSERFADPLSDAESFRLDGTRVVDIGRRAAVIDEVGGQYMGLLKITPAGWAAIDRHVSSFSEEHRDRLDMTTLLSGLIQTGLSIEAVPVSGSWGEVDSADDLALYEGWIAEGRMSAPVWQVAP